MPAVFVSLAIWFLGNSAARVLLGAGLSVVSVVWLEGVLNGLLADFASMISSGASDIVAVIGTYGVWIAISNLGSALLMRAAILGAANIMGLRKTN